MTFFFLKHWSSLKLLSVKALFLNRFFSCVFVCLKAMGVGTKARIIIKKVFIDLLLKNMTLMLIYVTSFTPLGRFFYVVRKVVLRTCQLKKQSLF